MYILTINVGSSSTKFGLFSKEANTVKNLMKKTVEAGIEHIPVHVQSIVSENNLQISDITFAMRVVHGGPELVQPTVITPTVLEYLHAIQSLAPLHNPPALQVIHQLIESYPNNTIIAAFDTMFHSTMPHVASSYALPNELAKKHHIKRYGFHGFAYASICRLYSEQLHVLPKNVTVIALQLGSGCSICAIKNGESVDTSMGFSPLEGLISRTRTGSIDPTVLEYLHEKTNTSHAELINVFNNDSGLKGVSNTDGHMPSLIEDVDEHKQLAIDLFVYRIQHYIGAYDVVLQQQAPIILAGGISEHLPSIWEKIFNNPYLNVALSPISSIQLSKPFTRISSDSSKRHAYVAYVDEEYEIASSVNTLLQQ